MPSRIEICETLITQQDVTAIVNETNPTLQPETPNDVAIHQAAGPKLSAECAHVAPCPEGEARITRGYDLPANYIIHTVAPLWGGGESGEDHQLANCYRNIFKLANDFEITNLALPPISSGEKGFPDLRAAHIAMREIMTFLNQHPQTDRLILCCPDEQAVQTYEAAFDKCSS